jgi:hypothetical protein
MEDVFYIYRSLVYVIGCPDNLHRPSDIKCVKYVMAALFSPASRYCVEGSADVYSRLVDKRISSVSYRYILSAERAVAHHRINSLHSIRFVYIILMMFRYRIWENNEF